MMFTTILMITIEREKEKFQATIKQPFIKSPKKKTKHKIEYILCLLQSYFSVPKEVRLNCTHYLIMKIDNKRELQNIATNHSADIEGLYKDLQEMYMRTIFFSDYWYYITC